MTERRKISPKVRAAVIESYGGKCAECGGEGPFDIDHIHALIFNGPDEPSNMRPLCIECHKRKTARDIAANAKGKRIRRKAEGTWRTNRKRIQSRPFDTTKVRTVSGEARERATHRARMA